MTRIRLALGGAIAGSCIVGFVSGLGADQAAPWIGAAIGFTVSYVWLWRDYPRSEQPPRTVTGYGFDKETGREFPCDKDGKEVL